MSILGFIKGVGKSKGESLEQLEINSNITASCEARTSISLTIDEHAIEPMSMFLESNPDKGWILIDTCTPDIGNRYISKSEVITVSYHLNNLGFRFNTNFIEHTKNNGYPAIRISFPERIITGQKRKYFRVEPSLEKPVSAYIRMGGEPPLEAKKEIRDISEGGFSFQATEDFFSNLKKGAIIDEIMIELPSLGKIKTKGIIRGLFKLAGKNYVCGIEFIQMQNPDMNKIYKYVVNRQREELKNLRT